MGGGVIPQPQRILNIKCEPSTWPRTLQKVCGGRSTAYMVKIHSLYVVVESDFSVVQLEPKLNPKIGLDHHI